MGYYLHALENAAVGGLMIDIVVLIWDILGRNSLTIKCYTVGTNNRQQTNIVTYRLNRPKG